MQDTLNSQDLAQQTADDIVNNLKTNSSDEILDALKTHYEVLNRTQQMHIDFLSEFIKNLKNLQTKDKESLDNLKKQVLSHVLKNQTK
jgi:hypothetical protein